MMSSVEQLLRAAKYIEMQEGRQHQYGGCTPPDSPVTASDHHLIQFNGDVITNVSTSRIDARNDDFIYINMNYKGDTYFWGMSPSAGDSISFNFTPPVEIDKYLFRSGNLEHPEDRLPLNTTVEVLPVDKEFASRSLNATDGWDLRTLQKTPDGFAIIGLFRANGIADGVVPIGIGEIRTIRIRVATDSQRWAILSEIYIKKR